LRHLSSLHAASGRVYPRLALLVALIVAVAPADQLVSGLSNVGLAAAALGIAKTAECELLAIPRGGRWWVLALLAGAHGTLGLVFVLALATTVMTNLVTNAATAAIITPVALRVAADAGADPVTVLALIGTCVSFTLINPYSHQSNVMVMQPGGYTGAQFTRFGAPILAACLMTAGGVAYLLLS
jgi:Na+/H+ antiporter NhaD/arsenite permease-like protein